METQEEEEEKEVFTDAQAEIAPEPEVAADLAAPEKEKDEKVSMASLSPPDKNTKIEPKPRPDISLLHAAILKAMTDIRNKAPDWHLRQGYVQRDVRILSETALTFFRLAEFKIGYAMFDPFPASMVNAKYYRDLQRQHESKKGSGFVGFLTEYLDQVKHNIRRIHHCVLGLYTQQQREQLYNTTMINVDVNNETDVRRVATFKVECERLSLMFADVCSGMYDTKIVKDTRFPEDSERKIVQTGVYQMPFYAMLHTDLNKFDNISLVEFINAYQLAVCYSVIALQIQTVFETLKDTRLEAMKERNKDPEDLAMVFPVQYRKVYIRFCEVFSPFISDTNSIKINFHTRAILSLVQHELLVEFAHILENSRPGKELLKYDKAICDEKELEELIRNKVEPTHFYPPQYLTLLEKLAKTSNFRRSDKFKAELLKKYGKPLHEPEEEEEKEKEEKE